MAVALVPGAPAVASGGEKEAFEAAKRISAETHTQSDIDLVMEYPDLARRVPAPDTTAETETWTEQEPKMAAVSSAEAAYGSRACNYWGSYKRMYGQRTQKSLSGAIMYRYRVDASWCQRNGAVYRILGGTDSANKTDGAFNWGKSMVNRKYVGGVSSGVVWRQRQVKMCVFKWGCYFTGHPQIKLVFNGKGVRHVYGTPR